MEEKGNYRPLSEKDLKPFERINEKGQLEIDVNKANEQGARIFITHFPINEGDAEFEEEITPAMSKDGIYTFGPKEQD